MRELAELPLTWRVAHACSEPRALLPHWPPMGTAMKKAALGKVTSANSFISKIEFQ